MHAHRSPEQRDPPVDARPTQPRRPQSLKAAPQMPHHPEPRHFSKERGSRPPTARPDGCPRRRRPASPSGRPSRPPSEQRAIPRPSGHSPPFSPIIRPLVRIPRHRSPTLATSTDGSKTRTSYVANTRKEAGRYAPGQARTPAHRRTRAPNNGGAHPLTSGQGPLITSEAKNDWDVISLGANPRLAMDQRVGAAAMAGRQSLTLAQAKLPLDPGASSCLRQRSNAAQTASASKRRKPALVPTQKRRCPTLTSRSVMAAIPPIIDRTNAAATKR